MHEQTNKQINTINKSGSGSIVDVDVTVTENTKHRPQCNISNFMF
jgi:hypothetical protein